MTSDHQKWRRRRAKNDIERLTGTVERYEIALDGNLDPRDRQRVETLLDVARGSLKRAREVLA